jgi:hypothetical protein
MDYNDVTTSILRSAGFTHAYTTVQRRLSRSDNKFALPRIGIDAGESLVRQRSKQLAPWISRSQATEIKIRRRVSTRDLPPRH